MQAVKTITTDLLVIGSGIAGAYAALTARSFGADVVLASKTSTLMGGSTLWAQGGIAAPLSLADEDAHAADTMQAGRGLCEPASVRAFVREAKAHVENLTALGVAFDAGCTLEGGHSRPRIRHTGDATGQAISKALSAALASGDQRGLTVKTNTFAQNLRLLDDRIIGADLQTPSGPLRVLAAGTLLASGGFGQIFPSTTAPQEGTGDGLMLAYRAGAVLRDLEFVQFHPTAVLQQGRAYLVTEAARGEGGYLLNAQEQRFMQHYDPLLELAPRDVVARAIASERDKGQEVFLDLRHLGAEFVARRFPTIQQTLGQFGLDLGRDLIPVQPAVHYTIGGVQTDESGRCSLAGLYAAGEVASSGLHGANRLASNSLSEGLVFGARAARTALAEEKRPSSEGQACPSLSGKKEQLPAIRALVGQAAGLRRNGPELQTALEQLQNSPQLQPKLDLTPKAQPSQAAKSPEQLATGNLLELAPLVLQLALQRQESRGGHYRNDFTQLAGGRPLHSLIWQTATGQPQLEHVPVGKNMLRFEV